MKYILTIILAAVLVGCSESDEQKAERMLAQIDSLYEKGQYKEVLDSIVSLRTTYPSAINIRKKALRIWQNASLKIAQKDVAQTDVLLQETLRMIESETDLRKANMLRMRRDSLQARYEAMCGVVKMIHMRQKEL
jgi:hypothetical protein